MLAESEVVGVRMKWMICAIYCSCKSEISLFSHRYFRHLLKDATVSSLYGMLGGNIHGCKYGLLKEGSCSEPC